MKFPPIPGVDRILQSYLTSLHRFLQSELGARPTKAEPVDEVLIRSPNKSIWKITVDDTGDMATTKVRDA